VRKVELCVGLGFPRTSRFILEGGRGRAYDAAQLKRLADAEGLINNSIRDQEGR
jgi:hypothetical protein